MDCVPQIRNPQQNTAATPQCLTTGKSHVSVVRVTGRILIWWSHCRMAGRKEPLVSGTIESLNSADVGFTRSRSADFLLTAASAAAAVTTAVLVRAASAIDRALSAEDQSAANIGATHMGHISGQYALVACDFNSSIHEVNHTPHNSLRSSVASC
jgi:hypothetical protein